MSEQPQGPGWWQASDGKYYPPESAPGAQGALDQEGQTSLTPTTATTEVEPPKKSIFKRWWFWLLVVLGLVIIIGVIASGGDTDDTDATATPTTEATPTEEPTPTETEEPEPTETEEPEPTPTPEPPAEPVTYTGSGDTVLPIEKPADIVIATFSHQGESNFIVKSLDSNLDLVDGLVNTIGNYEGTVLMDALEGEQSTSLEINADGAWTVTLADFVTAPRFSAETTGSGDQVWIYDGDPGIATITHEGESNFIVRTYSDTGVEGLVNEIGNYSGTVPFRDAPAVVTVRSEGTWSIAVS